MSNLLALDSETTGLDHHAGARPFLVTMCREDEKPHYWEVDVDPLSRIPLWDRKQLLEIKQEIDEADSLILHNAKFDLTALTLLFRDHRIYFSAPWHKTLDTLIASHLLCSNQPHDLTSLAIQYLGEDISKHEKRLKSVVKQARLRVKRDFPQWKIASKENPLTPSAKNSTWGFDMWLPRAYAKATHITPTHHDREWWTICADYANPDSITTLYLWLEMERQIKSRGLERIFAERMKVAASAMELEMPRYKGEIRGITINSKRAGEMVKRYERESRRLGQVCVGIADSYNYPLELPKTGNNYSLQAFCFGGDLLVCKKCGHEQTISAKQAMNIKGSAEEAPNCSGCSKITFTNEGGFTSVGPKMKLSKREYLGLPKMRGQRLGKNGFPALDKAALDAYATSLQPRSKQRAFVKSLQEKRKIDTASVYLRGYSRYWQSTPHPDYHILHGVANPTGTDTLRWSFSNPNQANVSKQENNLRYALGPLPGREWYSMDGQNLELRIPTYEAQEIDLMWIFDHPNDPPYFGSYHLAVFDLLHPAIFKKYGKAVKSKYEATLYQWVKNGNFACVPMDTLALTEVGWKGYSELNVGDKVAAYKDGKLIWTPILKKVRYDKAPLIRIRTKQYFDVVCTPNHRWLSRVLTKIGEGAIGYVNQFVKAENIKEQHSLILSAELEDESRLPISAVEASIIALVYTEGSIETSKAGYVGAPSQAKGRKVKFSANIHQSKPDGIKYIDDLLAKWGKPYKKYRRADGCVTWCLNPDAARDLWNRAELKTQVTKFDQDFEALILKLGTTNRKAFLEAVYIGEGWLDQGKYRIVGQNRGPFADCLKLAMFLDGNFVSEILGSPSYPTDNVYLNLRACKPYVTGQKIIKEEVEDGAVWCIQTETGTWVMQQEGRIMLTGNTIYGCQEAKADETYHVQGAYKKIRHRFPNIAKLSDKQIALANKYGYVTTIPDRDVDPLHGYPINCSRTEWGGISPTVPLNYHIQSTAMWWTCRAMVKCHEQIREWQDEGFDLFMVLQVHDELDFDSVVIQPSELWRIARLKSLMESCGTSIGVPTPVSVERHTNNWAEGEDITKDLNLLLGV